MYKIACIIVALWMALAGTNVQAQTAKKAGYNVLFIFIDDLRPDLGVYGNKQIVSPNIDKLAGQGVVFNKQFVTVPTCGASRASLLTGLFPRNTNELANEAFEFKKTLNRPAGVPESFVHALRKNGYYTVGIGKISHSPDGYIYKYQQPRSNDMELPESWDEMLLDAGKWGTGWNAFFGYANGTNRNTLKGEVKPYENAEGGDETYVDGLTTNLAVKKLKELAGKKQPFFLGVGFFKPHLPFTAPKKYWDLYDESKITLTSSPDLPQHVNTASFHNSAEFNGYKQGEEKASLSKPVSDAYARQLRHAYYAGVSYIDAQVGKLLKELNALNLDKNTIIVLWGDHGWHLGDDRVWGKHTLSEYALRSPLIIKTPGGKPASCDKVVSSIDIYPTLMELCNIGNRPQTDGKSLVPLLKNSKYNNWENTAYSYYNKGVSVRTDRYRFTRYFRKAQPVDELYDHSKDPYENNNVAGDQPGVVQSLEPLWNKGNTGLYTDKSTSKLIIITLDGYRWKEVFRGADSAYLFDKQYTSQDSDALAKKFWANDTEERRKKLMPFLWNTVAQNGQLYGNRDQGNYVNVKNRYWFSYPGYNEMFTGYPDTLVNSNNYKANPNVTVLEFINKQKGYEQQVAAFTSWNAFNRILNKQRCGFPVNAGYADLELEDLNETQKVLNEQQHFMPKIFGSAERPDATTYFMAKEYLKEKHPKVLQLSFIDTDAFAHQGKYDFYLDAAHYNDAMIADLWKYIQSDPFYKDQTTLFIAVDHGRGDGATWRNHNASTPHSDEIWLGVMGPQIKPLGELRTPGQLYQFQYAKTIAALLGFDFTSPNPIGNKIESIVSK